MMQMRGWIRFIAVAAGMTSAVALGSPAALAAAAHRGAAELTFDLGPSPIGLPGNCPFENGDANFIYLDGNAVAHSTSNANGDRGGDTAEGTAQFLMGSVALYQGHLTIHGGGNANARSESMQGFTLNFNGTGPAGALRIHVTFHESTNAAGSQTADVLAIHIACTQRSG